MKKIVKNNLLMLKYITRFCPNHIIITLINSILSSLVPVFYILFTRYLINAITKKIDFKSILFIIFLFLIFNLCVSFFNIWLQQKITPRNTQILNQKMQAEIFNKAMDLDLECYEDSEFYNKFNMAFQQSDTRALAVLNTFSTLIGSLFGIASLVTLISSFASLILIFIIINVLVSFYYSIKLVNTQHQYYEDIIPYQRESEYAKRVFYQKEYAKEFRLFYGIQNIIITNFNKSIDKIISFICIKGKKFSKYIGIQNAYNTFTNSLIMLYLAYEVITKNLNIGDFVALSNGSQQLAGQITQFLNVFPQLYEHSIYIENFVDFMNYKSRINKNNKLQLKEVPNIEFKNVSFAYPNSKKSILKDINIKIAAGEKIAFVGCNGAGKSTLIKLLCRLYDITEGEIMLNNIAYHNYDVNSLRNGIGIIFQEYQSFSISIAENILMRPINNRLDDEAIVVKSLKYVGLYNKVHALSDGIYTVLTREFDNNGAIFSGGELQKLAIARIYAQNSHIIILDEPSSALDPISENDIFNSVLNFASGKTVILISHRLTNIKNVDRIFFIENGLLLESGSHEELMRIDGKYAEMYNIQANKYTNTLTKIIP